MSLEHVNMDAILSQCRWPVLAETYNRALREAVGYVLERFAVHGIVVSGSIIRGNPDR